MNGHTSGCMRLVSVRKTPRSGGIVTSSPEHVLEHARPATPGMDGLGDLRELERVAEQDEVPRRAGGGERIGQGQLARLVDDQHVDRCAAHVRAGEQPRGAGDEVEVARGAGRVVWWRR